MVKIKVIFFDIDNTLLNHSGSENKALKSIYKKYFPRLDYKKFKSVWQKWSKENWKLYELKQLTFDEQRSKRIIDTWKEFGKSISIKEANNIFNTYLSFYELYWQSFPHVLRTIKKLYKKGFILGIITNGNKNQQINKLKSLNLYSFFNPQLIVVSEETKYSKPAKEIFLHAQSLTCASPNEIMMIGDSIIQDIEGGQKVGWNTLLIDHNNRLSIPSFKLIDTLF